MLSVTVAWLVAVVLLVAPMAPMAQVQAHAQDVIYGELDASDPVLDGGEHYDRYEFELQAGDRIEADVVSLAFDTFLAVVSPDGQDVQNDDWEEDATHSRVSLVADAPGTWTVLVTSFSAGEVGAYTLNVTLNGPEPLGDGTILPQDVQVPEGQKVLLQQVGHLGAQSQHSPVRGEPYDSWEVEVQAGQTVTVTMTSDELDAYLAVFPPNQAAIRNDDGASDVDAQVVVTVQETGTLRINAGSYEVDAAGKYQLVVTCQEPKATGPVSRDVINTQGRFQSGDGQRRGGQWVDVYRFDAEVGDEVTVHLSSGAVDPHLFLTAPNGQIWENDDFDANIDQSQIRLKVEVAGSYQVEASTFAKGEAGAYTLKVTVTTPGTASGTLERPQNEDQPRRGQPGATPTPSDANPTPATPKPNAGTPTGPAQPPVRPQASKRVIQGMLGDEDDEVADTREFYDLHRFEAKAGQTFTIVLASNAFDTYLEVTSPSGTAWENDDDGVNVTQSILTIQAPEDGTYVIKATSFYPQEKGAYTLTIDTNP